MLPRISQLYTPLFFLQSPNYICSFPSSNYCPPSIFQLSTPQTSIQSSNYLSLLQSLKNKDLHIYYIPVLPSIFQLYTPLSSRQSSSYLVIYTPILPPISLLSTTLSALPSSSYLRPCPPSNIHSIYTPVRLLISYIIYTPVLPPISYIIYTPVRPPSPRRPAPNYLPISLVLPPPAS